MCEYLDLNKGVAAAINDILKFEKGVMPIHRLQSRLMEKGLIRDIQSEDMLKDLKKHLSRSEDFYIVNKTESKNETKKCMVGSTLMDICRTSESLKEYLTMQKYSRISKMTVFQIVEHLLFKRSAFLLEMQNGDISAKIVKLPKNMINWVACNYAENVLLAFARDTADVEIPYKNIYEAITSLAKIVLSKSLLPEEMILGRRSNQGATAQTQDYSEQILENSLEAICCKSDINMKQESSETNVYFTSLPEYENYFSDSKNIANSNLNAATWNLLFLPMPLIKETMSAEFCYIAIRAIKRIIDDAVSRLAYMTAILLTKFIGQHSVVTIDQIHDFVLDNPICREEYFCMFGTQSTENTLCYISTKLGKCLIEIRNGYTLNNLLVPYYIKMLKSDIIIHCARRIVYRFLRGIPLNFFWEALRKLTSNLPFDIFDEEKWLLCLLYKFRSIFFIPGDGNIYPVKENLPELFLNFKKTIVINLADFILQHGAISLDQVSCLLQDNDDIEKDTVLLTYLPMYIYSQLTEFRFVSQQIKFQEENVFLREWILCQHNLKCTSNHPENGFTPLVKEGIKYFPEMREQNGPELHEELIHQEFSAQKENYVSLNKTKSTFRDVTNSVVYKTLQSKFKSKLKKDLDTQKLKAETDAKNVSALKSEALAEIAPSADIEAEASTITHKAATPQSTAQVTSQAPSHKNQKVDKALENSPRKSTGRKRSRHCSKNCVSLDLQPNSKCNSKSYCISDNKSTKTVESILSGHHHNKDRADSFKATEVQSKVNVEENKDQKNNLSFHVAEKNDSAFLQKTNSKIENATESEVRKTLQAKLESNPKKDLHTQKLRVETDAKNVSASTSEALAKTESAAYTEEQAAAITHKAATPQTTAQVSAQTLLHNYKKVDKVLENSLTKSKGRKRSKHSSKNFRSSDSQPNSKCSSNTYTISDSNNTKKVACSLSRNHHSQVSACSLNAPEVLPNVNGDEIKEKQYNQLFHVAEKKGSVFLEKKNSKSEDATESEVRKTIQTKLESKLKKDLDTQKLKAETYAKNVSTSILESEALAEIAPAADTEAEAATITHKAATPQKITQVTAQAPLNKNQKVDKALENSLRKNTRRKRSRNSSKNCVSLDSQPNSKCSSISYCISYNKSTKTVESILSGHHHNQDSAGSIKATEVPSKVNGEENKDQKNNIIFRVAEKKDSVFLQKKDCKIEGATNSKVRKTVQVTLESNPKESLHARKMTVETVAKSALLSSSESEVPAEDKEIQASAGTARAVAHKYQKFHEDFGNSLTKSERRKPSIPQKHFQSFDPQFKEKSISLTTNSVSNNDDKKSMEKSLALNHHNQSNSSYVDASVVPQDLNGENIEATKNNQIFDAKKTSFVSPHKTESGNEEVAMSEDYKGLQANQLKNNQEKGLRKQKSEVKAVVKSASVLTTKKSEVPKNIESAGEAQAAEHNYQKLERTFKNGSTKGERIMTWKPRSNKFRPFGLQFIPTFNETSKHLTTNSTLYKKNKRETNSALPRNHNNQDSADYVNATAVLQEVNAEEIQEQQESQLFDATNKNNLSLHKTLSRSIDGTKPVVCNILQTQLENNLANNLNEKGINVEGKGASVLASPQAATYSYQTQGEVSANTLEKGERRKHSTDGMENATSLDTQLKTMRPNIIPEYTLPQDRQNTNSFNYYLNNKTKEGKPMLSEDDTTGDATELWANYSKTSEHDFVPSRLSKGCIQHAIIRAMMSAFAEQDIQNIKIEIHKDTGNIPKCRNVNIASDKVHSETEIHFPPTMESRAAIISPENQATMHSNSFSEQNIKWTDRSHIARGNGSSEQFFKTWENSSTHPDIPFLERSPRNQSEMFSHFTENNTSQATSNERFSSIHNANRLGTSPWQRQFLNRAATPCQIDVRTSADMFQDPKTAVQNSSAINPLDAPSSSSALNTSAFRTLNKPFHQLYSWHSQPTDVEPNTHERGHANSLFAEPFNGKAKNY